MSGRRRRLVELLWRTFCTSKDLSWTCLERATSGKTLRREIARRALRWTSLTFSTVRPQLPTDGADTRSPLVLVFLLLFYTTSHNHPVVLSHSLYALLSDTCNSGVRCRWWTNPGRIGPRRHRDRLPRCHDQAGISRNETALQCFAEM